MAGPRVTSGPDASNLVRRERLKQSQTPDPPAEADPLGAAVDSKTVRSLRAAKDGQAVQVTLMSAHHVAQFNESRMPYPEESMAGWNGWALRILVTATKCPGLRSYCRMCRSPVEATSCRRQPSPTTPMDGGTKWNYIL